MRPIRLQMDGFGTFRDSVEIDFTGIDLVALVGATGAGKSTIIDAITFALYGAIARYDDNRAVAPVINQTSTRARVCLDFELDDRTYTAMRLVLRLAQGGATTKEARLEVDDEVLASDARTMNARVEELLGLDVEQFNRTVVLPQGRFAGFLHDTPERRQATLRQLLGFEIYKRMGQAARQRRDVARLQIDTIQGDIADREGDLSAQRRTILQLDFETVVNIGEQVRTASAHLHELESRVSPLEQRVARIDGHVALLGSVHLPDDSGDLDDQLVAARLQAQVTADERADARATHQAAADAAAAGPDLAQCQVNLAKRQQAASLVDELARAAAESADARAALEAAISAASTVTSQQVELDAAVESARTADSEARDAAAEGPQLVRIDGWRQTYRRHEQLRREVGDAEAELNSAQSELEPLVAVFADASAAEHHAREQLDRARQLAGAVSMIELLVVGEPCPVCRQHVKELPGHDPSVELTEAQVEHEGRRVARAAAKADHDRAADRVREATAAVEARRSIANAALKELTSVPALDELDALQNQAEVLFKTLEEATARVRSAVADADAHRSDPANLAVVKKRDDARDRSLTLDTTEQQLRQRLEAAEASLAAVPPAAELATAIKRAEQLAQAVRGAEEHRRAAESAKDQADSQLEQTRRDHAAAAEALVTARERVVVLGPPRLEGHQLRADLAALSAWAAGTADSLRSERADVSAQLAQARADFDRAGRDIRAACASVLSGALEDVDVDVATLRERLASKASELKAEIKAFDDALEALTRQRSRIADLQEQADVADMLGDLLRADGFEGWLMESALANLADSASRRLRELSGGQFSLELQDRAFMVRDHGNADELRNAKTLSGGETFLASLSLALALADATAELAAEGAPPIESIFLDEGFGTLDPTTLDTVAAAIEELGASGRMVGIVTHIRELADRMPVRLEVTRAGGTATVERVDQ